VSKFHGLFDQESDIQKMKNRLKKAVSQLKQGVLGGKPRHQALDFAD
jgi:hypothetical protein